MTNKSKIPPQPEAEPARPASQLRSAEGTDATSYSVEPGTVGKDGPPAGKSTDPASPDYLTGVHATQDPNLTAGAGGSGQTGEQPVGGVAASLGSVGLDADTALSGADLTAAQRRKLQDKPQHEWPEDMQRQAGFLWSDSRTHEGRVIEYSVFGANDSGTTTRRIVLGHGKDTDADAEAARVRLSATQ